VKRRPPAAGRGRPKGALNKITRAFRESTLLVYDRLGGDDAYLAWAAKHQNDFYRAICPRMIPTEMIGPGPAGEHMVRTTVVHEYRDA